jgi:hypothetical protein
MYFEAYYLIYRVEHTEHLQCHDTMTDYISGKK